MNGTEAETHLSERVGDWKSCLVTFILLQPTETDALVNQVLMAAFRVQVGYPLVFLAGGGIRMLN